MLPTVLHVLIAISGGFAVGSEFRYRSLSEWLAVAGGRPVVALAGKLAPYLALFLVQFASAWRFCILLFISSFAAIRN